MKPVADHPAVNVVGRRKCARLRTRLRAKLITLGGARTATLVDLSQTGARLAMDEPLSRGSDTVLCWAGLEAFGRVSWSDKRQCGIEFYDPLPPSALIHTRDLDPESTDLEQARRAAQVHVNGYR